MAAASCTLTGTIKDITGMAMDPSRVVVQLVATVQMILDSTVGEMRVGQKQVKPDAQGRWTFTNVWLTDTADTNPASFRWRLVLQAWPDSASPSVTYQTSDFPITSTGVINIKDVDFVPVDPDPGWKSIFQSRWRPGATTSRPRSQPPRLRCRPWRTTSPRCGRPRSCDQDA